MRGSQLTIAGGEIIYKGRAYLSGAGWDFSSIQNPHSHLFGAPSESQVHLRNEEKRRSVSPRFALKCCHRRGEESREVHYSWTRYAQAKNETSKDCCEGVSCSCVEEISLMFS